MRPLTAVAWKEWREHRWFLLAAAAIFIGYPLLMAGRYYYRFGQPVYTDDAIGMVLGLGALLAIILAAGATCRDLPEDLHGFWRSRPVGAGRWALTKYAVGAGVLLGVTCGALVVQLAIDTRFRPGWHTSTTTNLLLHHTFLLLLVYSVSFLIGCLVRQAARAALVSLLAGGLLCFLPTVLPPLARLSVVDLLLGDSRRLSGPAWLARDLARAWPFLLFTLVGSAAAVGLSVLALRRDWRLHVDKRFISWALVGVLLVLWAGAAFQLGSNLECVRAPVDVAAQPGQRRVAEIAAVGDEGVLLLEGASKDRYGEHATCTVCRFDASGGQVRLGREVALGDSASHHQLPGDAVRLAWSPTRPRRAHFLREKWRRDGRRRRTVVLELCTVAFEADWGGTVVHRLDLLPHRSPAVPTYHRIVLHGDRLYVPSWPKVLVVGLGDPDAPRLLDADVPCPEFRWRRDRPEEQSVFTRLRLLPGEGLSLRQRVALSARLAPVSPRVAVDGDLLVAATRYDLTTYRIARVAGDTAELEMIARRPPTPLERLVHVYPRRIVLRDGMAYVVGAVGVSGLSAYDLRDPARPRRVGHYAAPQEYFTALATLRDGTILAAGRQLHLIAPPQK